MPLDDSPRLRPPSNNEAEQSLLGAILVNNAAYHRVADVLRPEHFAEEVHGRIFEAIAKMVDRGSVANVVTLRSLFDQDGALAEIGGGAYLARLAASVVTIVNAPHYAEVIRDCWARREVMRVAEDAHAKARDPDLDITGAAIATEMQGELDALEQDDPGVGLVSVGELVNPTLDQVQDAVTNKGRVVGVTTGLVDLNRAIGGLRPGRLYILAARPSMGKAQPLHALVRTPAGWKTMGDVKVGDAVAGPDGSVSTVTEIHPQGPKQVYRVRFYDGRTVECCADHLWQVHSKHWKAPRVIETRELQRRLGLVRYKSWLHVPLAVPAAGVPKSFVIPPYVMGVLLGDGCIAGRSVQFSCFDPEIVARVDAVAAPDYRTSSASPRGGFYSIIRTVLRPGVRTKDECANGYGAALIGYGLLGCKSGAKFIPPEYLEGSEEQRLELLRGLLDTDGTVEPSGTVRYCTVSPQLAADVQRLVWSLGGICRIALRKKGRFQQARILTVRHPNAASLFSLPRKICRLPKSYKYKNLRLRVESVEPVGETECKCITVSRSDGLYLTDGFVVTHNSMTAKTLAYAAARAEQARAEEADTPPAAVAFFTLEMSSDEVMQALLADMTGISASRQERGEVDANDIARLAETGDDLRALPLRIDDTPALALAQIRARARGMKRKGGLSLIVIDHLGLMSASREAQKQGPTAGVTETTRGLKKLAKELGVPILALCQLNRSLEARDDKRPTLADLRQSGSIEEDADVVIFVYRQQYYLERSEPEKRPGETVEKFDKRRADWQDDMDRCRDLAELIIAKQRGGPVSTVRVRFEPEHSRMANLARGI